MVELAYVALFAGFAARLNPITHKEKKMKRQMQLTIVGPFFYW